MYKYFDLLVSCGHVYVVTTTFPATRSDPRLFSIMSKSRRHGLSLTRQVAPLEEERDT